MQCPFCGNEETKVIDKRDVENHTKRRRECLKCEKRFNTKEIVEIADLRVIKKDGRIEPFMEDKLRRGIMKACEKRPIANDTIEKMMHNIQERLSKEGKEVKSSLIGEMVIKELKKIDKVAYIRFASVYKDFDDISDFKKEIMGMIKR